jgi:hypothetical protein
VRHQRAALQYQLQQHRAGHYRDLTFRPAFAYAFAVAEDDRRTNALLIAASLIAAVRCAREEEIKPIPRVICKVSDSVRLAKMVLQRIERHEEGI